MKDKKYTIEVTQTSKKFNMHRENNGFSIWELIGIVELVRTELIQQAFSSFDKPDIKRTFITDNKKGEIEIILKEDSKE